MTPVEVNQKLKDLAGKKTVAEAKIELGRMLALAYSCAYDNKAVFGLDVERRWQVVLDKRGYTVLRYTPSLSDDKWDPWVAMTFGRAYQYVTNPAILMLRAGCLETFEKGSSNTVFHKRDMLMPWINPNDIADLIVQAVDAYVKGEGRLMYETSTRSRLKEPEYTPDGNKILIDTGHAAFDKQTNSIGPANHWANTIHGNFIRPHQETGCNGFFFRPGELQRTDLKYYRDIGTPGHILNAVKQAAKDQNVILYAVFHWNSKNGNGIRIVHGFILTDAEYKLIDSWVTGPSWKSGNVVETVLPYIAWQERPWQIKHDATKKWTIENTLTGRTKFIGPVRSRGINYFDRAVAECERRNNLLAQKAYCKDGDK